MKKQIKTFRISDTQTISVVREITNYISQLPVTKSIKNNLFSLDFINSNPSYYVDYPTDSIVSPLNNYLKLFIEAKNTIDYNIIYSCQHKNILSYITI